MSLLDPRWSRAAFTALILVATGATAACSVGRGGSSGGGSSGSGGISLCVGEGCAPDGGTVCQGNVNFVIRGLGGPQSLYATGDTDGGTADPCKTEVSWEVVPETPPEVKPPPPSTETYSCPTGEVRIHIRDIWSNDADPTLGTLDNRPIAVSLVDINGQWVEYSARAESAGCDWYSTCIAPSVLSSFLLKVTGPDGCSAGNSGTFQLADLGTATDVWLDYQGNSSTLTGDYLNPTFTAGHFRSTTDKTVVQDLLCPAGPPDTTIPDGFTKLHVRWFWGDPADTGYPGTACGDEKTGQSAPPYPTSMRAVIGTCNNLPAMLEFQNGDCPWYTVLVPNSQWDGQNITLRYGSGTKELYSPDLPLPARTQSEYWLAYTGAPDDIAIGGAACMNWSNRANAYAFFSANPGPGYTNCGGAGDVHVDPCNPPEPDGYSTVHVRYLWAGQKTFTFFPKPEFMPMWIVMEVNGKDVICFREADRPWFNCPVPDAEFKAGATWRLVDKTHMPEWNTVSPRPDFPATPGEYWLRWYYGKPDIPGTSEFRFYDYYPDSTSGDWSATGSWDDAACADKPPATPISLGYGGWFPYNETGYAYPYGGTLAYTYADPQKVQDLLNVFVQERYERWKGTYIAYDDNACGEGTARVMTPLAGYLKPGTLHSETVSEGQGYGMAMAAAIGDKVLFDKLWKFTRHFLSQSAKKYCGGLMGWSWKGPGDCRPIDVPCDPDTEGCGGSGDSAFDGDVDIAIGLVFAARQWPEYTQAAVGWLAKMECEVNGTFDGIWKYPTSGDTWTKNCQNYPNEPCKYIKGQEEGKGTNLSYAPPGYFRVFGDFLKMNLSKTRYSDDEREQHRQFWYKTAETTYEMYERCYKATGVHPALVEDFGSYTQPCGTHTDNYNWGRYLWRVGVDAAWFGDDQTLPENAPGSSGKYPGKTRMQAKVDIIQDFYANFYVKNPPVPNANRFSTICSDLTPSGGATNCDPAYGHNSYFVNTAMTAFISVFDNDGKTTPAIRREALEEAVTTTVFNDAYFQESIGVYTMLFITGNFPNPMEVP
jgi:endo-1,4-beta-D-glucanase Y